MRALAYLVALGVVVSAAGCAPALTPIGEAAGSQAEAAIEPPPETLAGRWDIVLMDGSEPGEPMHASADDGAIWLDPGCAGMGFTYAIEADRIEMTRRTPEIVCMIAMPPETADFMDALAQADTVQTVTAGAIRLHGGGEVLLLVPREQ